MPKLSILNNYIEFKNVLDHAQPKIGFLGRRSIVYQNQIYSFDFLVKSLLKSNFEKDACKYLIDRIRHHDRNSQILLRKEHIIRRIFSFFLEYLGILFVNREKLLIKLEFSGKTSATSKGVYRLLILNGEKGTVACRVRGMSSIAFPKLSLHTGYDWSLRSFRRMRRLVAVRGGPSGTRMTGPADYFGDIENPHKFKFTINIDDKGVPVILSEKITTDSSLKSRIKEEPKVDPSSFTTRIRATWHKGSDPATKSIHQKYQDKGLLATGPSIFPDSGILEIDGNRQVILKKVDARRVDLSSFKARLVNNQTPFRITSEKLHLLDEYRAVSYLYESQYAKYQVEKGGGLFLETHEFVQTITPLDPQSKGFVTLAKWCDDTHTNLDIIGVEIPFGYTLIIDKFSIHGDTNLNGMFMMCMTSYHITMSKADCVFLKHLETKQNIDISIENTNDDNQPKNTGAVAERPISTYDTDCDKASFFQRIEREHVIFNYFFSHKLDN